MPTPFLKRLSKEKDIPLKELEEWWDEAKLQASNKFNKPESEFSGRQWGYVTSIVKRRAGDMSIGESVALQIVRKR